MSSLRHARPKCLLHQAGSPAHGTQFRALTTHTGVLTAHLQSWSSRNLYNLWLRTVGEKAREISFKYTSKTLFQQRWKSKAVVRAYHGDYINEKIFKRWYLPETLPDVRPRKQFGQGTGDLAALEAFAKRKKKEEDFELEEQRRGAAPVGSLMFSEVERRIDVFIFRCCFADSVYEARRLIIHGNVLLNGKKVGVLTTDRTGTELIPLHSTKMPTRVWHLET